MARSRQAYRALVFHPVSAPPQTPPPPSAPPGPPAAPATAPLSERPPTYEDYQPPRTTAEGGFTMLLSGLFAAAALVALLLAVLSKLLDLRTFGQISNLLVTAVVLLLLSLYILVWEITVRVIARGDE